MFRILLIVLSLVNVSFMAKADPSVGIHGMVIAPVDGRIIASHLPLHNSKHAHQLILVIKVSEQQKTAVNALLDSDRLVTLEPEVLSLTRLRNGELNEFTANLYVGHFERGGSKRFSDLPIKVEEILLDRHIHGGDNRQFLLVPVTQRSVLVVHKIGELPSFDQLIHASTDKAVSQLTGIEKHDELPVTRSNHIGFFRKHGLTYQAQLYLEFDDFVSRQD